MTCWVKIALHFPPSKKTKQNQILDALLKTKKMPSTKLYPDNKLRESTRTPSISNAIYHLSDSKE